MQITINNKPLRVKLARTPEEQRRGLMNTSSLPRDCGMLFVYPREQLLSFWMKDTSIPLQIAFIGADKRIAQIESLKPYSMASVKSNKPAKWALEVNLGWFDDNSIKVGDAVAIPSVIKIRVLK